MSKEAMKLALEALETDEQWGFVNKKVLERRIPAIAALREALEQPTVKESLTADISGRIADCLLEDHVALMVENASLREALEEHTVATTASENGVTAPEDYSPQQVEALQLAHRHDCGGNVFDCAGCEAAYWREKATCKTQLQVGNQEPVAWQGAEEWEPLAFQLCADENGEESCNELLWDGGVIPEPWGERWLKYEDEAKRMIEYVRKYAAPVRTKDLTDEELNAMWYGNTKDGWLGLFRAVIAADREKNRG
jgi:regulator of replication initiation timing|nr:MAG TPA: hypothetical protein [Caudoviricetes sp.]